MKYVIAALSATLTGCAGQMALMLAGVALLTGCASSSGVVPLGPDTYMLSLGGHVAFSEHLKIDAIREGNKYCSDQGKSFRIINSTSPHRMIIGGPPFTTSEIQFMCLGKGDRELTRPKMENPDSDVDITINKQ